MGVSLLVKTWNSYLAEMAQAWSAKCLWEHGQPAGYNTFSLPYTYVGQNLYATMGTLNVTAAITSWWNERVNYNYGNNTCDAGKMCGHYTQVKFTLALLSV